MSPELNIKSFLNEREYKINELEEVAENFITGLKNLYKDLSDVPVNMNIGDEGDVEFAMNDQTDQMTSETTGVASKVLPALVVGLSGNLGAGKTTFAQFCAKLLGVEETVTSPTFVIQKTYATKDPVFKSFVHIDAYRLESANELAVLGFSNTISEPNTLVFIEWPEKVADILPRSTIQVQLSQVDENTRKMSFN